MTSDTLNKRLEQIKLLLAAFASATLVLILIALGDMQINNQRYMLDEIQALDAWFGIWFVLQIGAPAPGVLLLVSRAWREVEQGQRIRLAFGFFLLFWLLLLGFYLRHMEPLGIAGGTLVAVLVILGVILLGSYLFARRAQPKSEEMFP